MGVGIYWSYRHCFIKILYGHWGRLIAVNLGFKTASEARTGYIYGDNNGVPSTTKLYSEAVDRTVSAAGNIQLSLSPAPILPPGNFYIAVEQTSTTNMSLEYTIESPLRSNTFYGRFDSGILD